jgi:hypothetical protein
VKLLALLIVIGFAVWYGGFLKGLVESGSWGWMALMFVWPVVLAWFVGDEADRADFYKIRDWIFEKLRLR